MDKLGYEKNREKITIVRRPSVGPDETELDFIQQEVVYRDKNDNDVASKAVEYVPPSYRMSRRSATRSNSETG